MNEKLQWNLWWLVLCTAWVGCQPAAPTSTVELPVRTNTPVALRLLVVDDPPLAATIESEYNARADGGVNVSQAASAELLTRLRENNSCDADAVVYPAWLLGELVERNLIVPLPEDVLESPQIDLSDWFSVLRLRGNTWGARTYALSFGSPSLVLFYRKDILEQSGLEPPRTWDEYQSLIEQLRTAAHDRPAGAADGQWVASAEPLGPGWACQVLLARAAASAKHPNNYSTFFHYKTMQPLINGEPFVRALKQLAAAARLGPTTATELTPHDVRRMLLEGRCAIGLTWPVAKRQEAGDAEQQTYAEIAFTELPGSTTVFHRQDQQWQERDSQESFQVPLLGVAGRLISVTVESARPAASFRLAGRLTGQELGTILAPASQATGPFRQSQLPARAWFPSGATLDQLHEYTEILNTRGSRKSWLTSLRIPGRERYMAELDRAVYRVLQGEMEVQQALDATAAAWNEITVELGTDRQAQAYRHSLGLDF
jgi:multiple sugar transport system substrate-binding protein